MIHVPTTLVFTATSTLLSRAIRAMSHSDVSHCGFGLTVDGARFVADSALLGCEMTTRERWLRSHQLVHEFEIPDADRPRTVDVLAALGAGYDYSGMLGYLPVWIARWFGRKIQNPLGSPTQNVCSEYVVRTMKSSKSWSLVDPANAYPGDLVRLCRELGYAYLG
jgi:hypothetical protein